MTTPIESMPRVRDGSTPLVPGIESAPGVCGGAARVAGTRITVRTLEQFRRLGVGEDELLENYPNLRREDIRNAWSYADAHRAEIDRQIRENEREDF